MFRPVKIRHYLAFMQARGYAPAQVLAGSGLNWAELSQPDFLMDIGQAGQIVANMIALCGEQGIGLDIGASTEMADLGLVGFVMMSARSVREAVHHWTHYSNKLVGMMMSVDLEERAEDDWSLVLSATAPLEVANTFCLEEQLVMIYRLGGQVISAQPTLHSVDLAYPQPTHHARYDQFFGAPIRFNATRTRINFRFPRLDEPLRGNDKDFNEVCERQCELLLQQVGRQSPLVARIKSVLLQAGGRSPGVGAVARELNLSARSLSRHLHDSGLSFQQLADGLRADLAKSYLRSLSLRPKEVAHLLGFDDCNSFHRAFKRWTGQTVQDYRASLRVELESELTPALESF